MTELSLNEATALARKAVRGKGLDWGAADEAGRAVRWLLSQRFDALSALADLLDAYAEHPRLRGNTLDADGPLCPICTGAAVADLSALDGFDGLCLTRVHTPLLLLPFAAAAARRVGRAMMIEGTGRAVTDGTSVVAVGDWTATSDLTLTPCDAAVGPARSVHRAPVSDDVLARLDAYAARTYAPATETSRRLGAGP